MILYMQVEQKRLSLANFARVESIGPLYILANRDALSRKRNTATKFQYLQEFMRGDPVLFWRDKRAVVAEFFLS